MDYWKNRDKNKKHAETWHDFIIKNNSADTKTSIENSIVYEPIFKNVENKTTFIVDQAVTVQAIFAAKQEGKIGVLNFASYKNPGGKYIDGSLAQEESLCHFSNLYEILSSDRLKKEFYEYNNAHVNSGKYDSRLIYSPDVVFYDKDRVTTKKCDVVTCAAPNKNAIQKNTKLEDVEIEALMKDRILHILNAFANNKAEILILGAFGCGVFGNDVWSTAEIFKECLTEYHYYKNVFKTVIFAIPDDDTYNKFRLTFENMEK